VIGAQAQGFNSQTAGIANIGDYTSVAASQESLAATANYIRWKLGIHGQPLSGPVTVRSSGGSASRYPAGAQVTLERVIGHRDTGRTACPGDQLYAQLDEIRALVESGGPLAPLSSTRLTTDLVSQHLDYATVVPIEGTLLGQDGNPLAGQILHVQVNSDNEWRTAKRAATRGDGSFSSYLMPRKRMYARIRYPGAAGARGTVSPRVLINLHPSLSFERAPKRGMRGRPVVVRGTVVPRKRVVHVVFQQRTRGRWRIVGRRAVRTRRGRFGTTFVPAFRARYRYYAATKSDLDTDRGATELHPLRVR